MARWCLGVDLGTSFSAGAVAVDGNVDILEVGGERRIPSTVLLNEQGSLIAGRLAQRSMLRAPERVERNPKRYVGRASMLLGGVPVDVKDAMAAILELFVAEGRTRFDGAPPVALVLTCPVAWREDRRAVLMAAGKKVVPDAQISLVEEPVASALHYASTGNVTRPNTSAAHAAGSAASGSSGSAAGGSVRHGTAGSSRVAVYDLGGGTFDAAVLVADGTDFSVVGEPGGDDMIGGEVFDERVYAFLGAQLEQTAGEWWAEVSSNPDRKYRAAAADLLEEARAAKETLSAYDTASQYVAGADADVHITRADLDALVGADIARTVDILDETINRSRIDRRHLSGIFITGGASRMPLVHETLRARHGDLVHTYDDPKIVVALGAARMAWMRISPQRLAPEPSISELIAPERTASDRIGTPTFDPAANPAGRTTSEPATSGHSGHSVTAGQAHSISGWGHTSERVSLGRQASEKFRTIMDGVIGVQINAAGTYVLCAEGDRHIVRRVNLTSGAADRELPFGQVLDWAAGDEGLLLAELGPGGTVVRTLTPELVIRSTQALPAVAEVRTLARGATGWAFYRNAPGVPVDHSKGLPWGETGDLAVTELSLSGFFGQEAPRIPLGPSAHWFVNEDNIKRRLFDQHSPTGVEPSLAYGSPGCTVVLGQFNSKTAMFQNVHQGFQPWQVLCVIDPGGRVHRVERHPPNWLQQVVLHESKWFVSTTAGLELDAAPNPPRMMVPRPRAGALRWFPAGREMFAVAMDSVLPSRGWSVMHCDRRSGNIRVLAHEPESVLLGHLTSRFRAERARIIADGESLWMGVAGGGGSSRILHVTSSGVREALTAPGWLEPVANSPAGLLCLHRADVAPGTEQALPARLRLLRPQS